MAIARIQSIGIDPASYQDDAPLASSTVLRNDGGRFLTEASGNYGLTGAANTQIDGWTDVCYSVAHDGTQGTTPFTSSATAGATHVPITRDLHQARYAFWIPAISTVTLVAGDINLICDLAVESSGSTTKQGVDTGTTTRGHVKIIGLDLVNNLALVSVAVAA